MYSASYNFQFAEIQVRINWAPNQVHIYILQKDGPYQQHLWLGYNIAI